jgi:hypothetical protein
MVVDKLTTNLVAMQSTKPRGQDEIGPSRKKNIPANNTRKVVAHTQASGSSAVPKILRRIEKVTKTDSQQDAKRGDTSQAAKERVHATMSDVQPSQTKRNTMQVEEMCKKMKDTKEDPFITLTEDDVEFMVEKAQDRGEEVVYVVEAHREDVISKLIESHETLQKL